MIDARLAIRFVLRVITIAVLVGFAALMGSALAWRWPLNFAVTGLLCGVFYYFGRLHEAEIQTRPTHTITSLPTASARRRSNG